MPIWRHYIVCNSREFIEAKNTNTQKFQETMLPVIQGTFGDPFVPSLVRGLGTFSMKSSGKPMFPLGL